MKTENVDINTNNRGGRDNVRKQLLEKAVQDAFSRVWCHTKSRSLDSCSVKAEQYFCGVGWKMMKRCRRRP
jgi:hypothetical protein